MLTSIPTFGELREIVRDAISRSQESIQTDTHALDAVAINNAMMYAQRKHDFNFNEVEVYCELNPTADILADMKLVSTDAAVSVKRIDEAYRINDQGDQYPVDYISKKFLSSCLKRRLDLNQIGTEQVETGLSGRKIIHHGQKLYGYPQATTLPERVEFDAVIYQPRMTESEDTNFLLQHGYDFIMYRSIIELNFFIKEDDRYQINRALVAEAWEALVDWDSRLVSLTETEIEL